MTRGRSSRLTYRPPYDWEAVLGFLRARAIPGVEEADGAGYRRTVSIDGLPGQITVRHARDAPALDLEVSCPAPHAVAVSLARVRRLFGLDADPAAFGAHLSPDPLLASPLGRHPGIRVPGAWDGFELAVRAILGQQVSVASASRIAGRLAASFGEAPWPGSAEKLFPTPERLARAAIERSGVIRVRAEAIRRLAVEVERGRLALDPGGDAGATIERLKEIRGVGEWTAQYIAMRACGVADALPGGDLVLRRAAGVKTARDLERRAEAWRPWRAYAVMLLWQDAVDRSTARG